MSDSGLVIFDIVLDLTVFLFKPRASHLWLGSPRKGAPDL